jgi:hypothetical protein
VIDSEVEEKILESISEGELPSLQVVVIDQNRLVWSKAFGQNTDPDFAYMNGSVQKIFDAAAILQFYEKGLIDLEDGGYLVAGFIEFVNGLSCDAILLRTGPEGWVGE